MADVPTPEQLARANLTPANWKNLVEKIHKGSIEEATITMNKLIEIRERKR